MTHLELIAKFVEEIECAVRAKELNSTGLSHLSPLLLEAEEKLRFAGYIRDGIDGITFILDR